MTNSSLSLKLGAAIRRGRPRDPAKREALLQAARTLFLDRGADGATMEEIAALAGVSKVTLYANFSDVTVLLEEVIRAQSQRVISDEYVETAKKLGLQAQLMQFGERALKFITDPERAKFERLLVSAAARHAGLGRRFFEAGPGRCRAILVKLIAEGVAAGELLVDDPVKAAEDLLGLWQGFLRPEIALGYRKTPLPPKELSARAARGVRLFLRLYGSSSKRSES